MIRRTNLWLREHVYQPTAYSSIGATGDQVVSILGANHLHRVYWVSMTGRG